jgi:hypothetical protein
MENESLKTKLRSAEKAAVKSGHREGEMMERLKVLSLPQ